MSKTEKKKVTDIFLGLHPLHRILLGVFLSAITFLIIPKYLVSPALHVTILWIVFSSTFILTSWFVLLKRSIEEIKKTATKDDGSKTVVFALILLSSFATLFTVLLLITRGGNNLENILSVIAAVIGMILSWIMVHTIFTFHYAHMYYDENKTKGDNKTSKGLDFPGSEEPDDIDFAYFSFVIGCTFQVSDVVITSRKIRRQVLFHALLSFVLNTFVVALTINLIAGLSK
jgi:uncharacterized membrane protein